MSGDPGSTCLIERWTGRDRLHAGTPSEPLDTDLLLSAIEGLRDLAGVDLARCTSLCEAAVQLADAQGNPSCRSRSRTVFAHALNYANEFEQASALLDTAESIAADFQLDYERARVLLVRVHTLARLGRLHEAKACGAQSETLFDSVGEYAWQARALTNTAIVVRMLGDPVEAASMFERALAVPGNDPTTEAQIRNCLAEAKLDSGDFVRAEREFLTAAESLDREGSPRLSALIRGNLADLYGRQGRLALALAQFEHARRYFETDNAPGDLGRILCEQAEVLAAVGETEIAARLAARAAAALALAGMVTEQTRSLRILGSLLGDTDPPRARSHLLEAATLSEAAGQVHDRGRSFACLGRIELQCGKLDRANELFERAESDLGSHVADALDVALARAELMLRAGNLDDALQQASEAVESATGLGVPTLRAAALALRARCLDALGQGEQARQCHLDAISMVELVRGTLGADMLRSVWQGRSTSIYDGAIHSCLRGGKTRQAFEVLEKRWGRGLLDRWSTDANIPAEPVSNSTAQLTVRLRTARHAVQTAYAAFDGSVAGQSRSDWLSRVRVAEERAREAELRLGAESECQAQLGVPAPIESIREALGEDDAVVSFLLAGPQSTALVLTKNDLHAVELGDSADEGNAVAQAVAFQMRRALARGPTAAGATRTRAAIGVLSQAHDALWRPLEDCLAGMNAVWVVAPEDFEAFPFAALHDGACFLCERMVFHRLPQASLIPVLRHRRNAAADSEPFGVIGCSDGIAGEMIREAEAIASLVPGAQIALGDDATSDALRRFAHGCGLVHVACHGAFPRENPLAAAIKLADRWVTVREMLEWSLPASTLVLSGCDTGRSDTRHGADPLGLLTGVLGAGGAGLVSSLWPAHDELARAFMERLYADIGPRPVQHDLAARLTASQQSMVRTGTHPAFWAQWVHIGV